MHISEIESRLLKIEKLAHRKQILYGSLPLTGPVECCHVFGIDNSTGDLYYKDGSGNWALTAFGGGGGGNSSCDTNIDGSTTHTGCPEDTQYISLLIDDGATPLPWRGTWDEFKTCVGASGGVGLRFGFAGEDDISSENRTFDNSNFFLTINGTDVDGLYHEMFTGHETSFFQNDNAEGSAIVSSNAAFANDAKVNITVESTLLSENTQLDVDATSATITQSEYGDIVKSIVTSTEGYLADVSGEVSLVSPLPNNGLIALASGLFVPASITDGLVYGGIVTWYSDYTYEVTAAGYYIQGTFYTSPAYTVALGNAITLSPADPTDNRIDVFYATTSGTVEVLEGTPSSTPSKPTVTSDELELSFAVVETGTTSPGPGTLVTEIIYLENVGEPAEWTPTVSAHITTGAGSSLVGTDPLAGILFTNSVNGNSIQLTNDVPLLVDTLSVVTFKIQCYDSSKAQSKKLLLSFSLGGTLVGNTVRLNNNDYGYLVTSLAVQTISIPLADFGVTTLTNIDKFTIRNVSTGNTTYSLTIDGIQLQGVHVTAPLVGVGNRFGIEDNLGLQNRDVDLQYNDLEIHDAREWYLSADLGAKTSSIIGNVWNTLPLLELNVADTAGAFEHNVLTFYPDRSVQHLFTDDLSKDFSIITPIPTNALYYMPLSVNGEVADSTGNIVVSGGGGGGRFGIEDFNAASDRKVLIPYPYYMEIIAGIDSLTYDASRITQAYDHIYLYTQGGDPGNEFSQMSVGAGGVFSSATDDGNLTGRVLFVKPHEVSVSTDGEIPRNVVLSINGENADAHGDVILPVGSSTKFGFAGEDDLAAEDRIMGMGNHDFTINNAANVSIHTVGSVMTNGLDFDIFSAALSAHANTAGSTSKFQVGQDYGIYSHNDGVGGLSEQHFVNTIGTFNIPLSVQVNGVESFADAAGKIDLGTIGGGSSRFGIEDNTGVQNRLIEMGSFDLDINAGTPDYSGAASEFNISSTSIFSFIQDTDPAIFSEHNLTPAQVYTSIEDSANSMQLTLNSTTTSVQASDYTAFSFSLNNIVSGLDDVTFSGTYTGIVAKTLFVYIDPSGTPDQFWWGYGVTQFGPFNVTAGSPILLGEGISVTFGATTGHTQYDQWEYVITANTSSKIFEVNTVSEDLFSISNDGSLQLNMYGDASSITGTAVHGLAVTSTGKVIQSGSPISELAAGVSTNSIDSGNYTQTWQWNTLGVNSNFYPGNVGIVLSSASGNADVGGQSQTLLLSTLTGANTNANASTYSIVGSNSHTGTNSTNVGLAGGAGSGTNNYGVRGTASASGGGGTSAGIYGTGSGSTSYGGLFENATTSGSNISLVATATGSGATTNTAAKFTASGATTNLAIDATGKVKFASYGAGSITGTGTYGLATDSSGNIIEVALGGGTTETASNGLTKTVNDIQLGGTLTGNVTIATGSNTLNITGSNASNPIVGIANSSSYQALSVSSAGTGVYASSSGGVGIIGVGSGSSGVQGQSTSSNGVFGTSTNGNGAYLQSTNAYGLQAFSTNSISAGFIRNPTVLNGLNVLADFTINNTGSSNIVSGMGGTVDFYLGTNSGFSSPISNQLVTKWSNATTASRVSEFSITGVDNAVTYTILQVSGTGLFTLARGLSNYANDAAAAAGSPAIPINGLYRNGSVVMIRVS